MLYFAILVSAVILYLVQMQLYKKLTTKGLSYRLRKRPFPANMERNNARDRHELRFSIHAAELTGNRHDHLLDMQDGFLDIGKIMMQTVLDAAKDLGYEQAELVVISDNKAAIALYEKLGFQKYGCFPKNMKYADGTYADADWMMKQL